MNYKNFIINYYSSRGIKYISNDNEVLKDNKKNTNIKNKTNNLVNETLNAINLDIQNCKKCALYEFRNNIVFGQGNEKAELMFIGEAPGQEEDLTANAFVGKAGELLTKIIIAMGLSRDEVYISNVVKCRPLANRIPNDEEILSCSTYLKRQIYSIKPKVIVALGAVASFFFFDKKIKISSVRGTFIEWNNIKIMPTFHPAYLLRNPNDKKLVWNDLKRVMEYLDLNKK